MAIRQWVVVSTMMASAALASGCATTNGNASAQSAAAGPRSCGAGVALVSPASELRGVAPVRGNEQSVANVDGNAVRFVDARRGEPGYSMRARAAINSDVGRGNVAEPCAF